MKKTAVFSCVIVFNCEYALEYAEDAYEKSYAKRLYPLLYQKVSGQADNHCTSRLLKQETMRWKDTCLKMNGMHMYR